MADERGGQSNGTKNLHQLALWHKTDALVRIRAVRPVRIVPTLKLIVSRRASKKDASDKRLVHCDGGQKRVCSATKLLTEIKDAAGGLRYAIVDHLLIRSSHERKHR